MSISWHGIRAPSPLWPHLDALHPWWPYFQIRSHSEVLGVRTAAYLPFRDTVQPTGGHFSYHPSPHFFSWTPQCTWRWLSSHAWHMPVTMRHSDTANEQLAVLSLTTLTRKYSKAPNAVALKGHCQCRLGAQSMSKPRGQKPVCSWNWPGGLFYFMFSCQRCTSSQAAPWQVGAHTLVALLLCGPRALGTRRQTTLGFGGDVPLGPHLIPWTPPPGGPAGGEQAEPLVFGAWNQKALPWSLVHFSPRGIILGHIPGAELDIIQASLALARETRSQTTCVLRKALYL